MMEQLIARGETIARRAAQAQAHRIAGQLRERLGESSVSAEDMRVIVRGKDLLQRWLADPALRFLGRGSK
jgi:hypothetical protein